MEYICHSNALDTWDMSSPFEALQQIVATAIKKIHGLCSIAMCHVFFTSTHIHQCKGTHTNQYTQISTLSSELFRTWRCFIVSTRVYKKRYIVAKDVSAPVSLVV